MTLTFTHLGTTRTLGKHPTVRAALAAGTITEAAAKLRPWYLRLKCADGKERTFKLSASDADAIRRAKDILNGRVDKADSFKDWLADRDARRGLTLGDLAAAWTELGLPDANGRARPPAAAARLTQFLRSALRYWAGHRAATVDRSAMNDFAAWRRANTPRGQGDRSADLELAALSCLCQWAVVTRRLDANPFAHRERYRIADDIRHCHDAMPDNDQQWHAILTWFWTANDPRLTIAGAWLAFCGLSGLRPGEPATLRNLTPATAFPDNLEAAAPGLIYPMPDGSRRMKVDRLKRGQNPAVTIHPALDDFLRHWRAWLAANSPSDLLFPLSPVSLNKPLAKSCRALKLRAMKPHGYGRAYYVRVRRSQGADDATIAVELGQTSNGQLIRSVYGEPRDPVGGNLHDWLPADAPPAWTLLATSTPANVVSL